MEKLYSPSGTLICNICKTPLPTRRKYLCAACLPKSVTEYVVLIWLCALFFGALGYTGYLFLKQCPGGICP